MKKKIRFSIRPVLGILMLVVSLFPIYWMISISLRSTEEMRGEVPFFPQSFTVSHYIELFQEQGFGQALINSTITTLASLAISLVHIGSGKIPAQGQEDLGLLGFAGKSDAAGFFRDSFLHYVY